MANKLLRGEETQLIQTYLDKRQATVAEWVALRNIFDVCTREMGYEVGGKLRVFWWIQVAVEKQMKVSVEDILESERVWRQ